MCLRSDFGIVACWCMFAQVAAGAPPPPTTATRTFLDADINRKGKIIGNRLTALYGGQLASAPGGATAAFVQTFVDNNKDAFGVSGVDLVFKSAVTIAAGKRAVYTYTQHAHGEQSRGPSRSSHHRRAARHQSRYVGYRQLREYASSTASKPGSTRGHEDGAGRAECGHRSVSAYQHIRTPDQVDLRGARRDLAPCVPVQRVRRRRRFSFLRRYKLRADRGN